jgi:hypothetical protein
VGVQGGNHLVRKPGVVASLDPGLLWGLSSESGLSSCFFLKVFCFLVASPLRWERLACAAPVCYPHANGLGAR